MPRGAGRRPDDPLHGRDRRQQGRLADRHRAAAARLHALDRPQLRDRHRRHHRPPGAVDPEHRRRHDEISGITIAGTDAARFAKSRPRPAARRSPPGRPARSASRSRRSAAGVFNATLHVADDALNNPHDANLTGTATIPGVQTTPTSLTFPAQQDGTLGATMQVTVKNTSASASLKVGHADDRRHEPGQLHLRRGGDACSGDDGRPGRDVHRPDHVPAACRSAPKSAALQYPEQRRRDRERRAAGSVARPAVRQRRARARRAAPRRTSAGRRPRRRAT